MQNPTELFDNNEKLKEFKVALERERYIASSFIGALVSAAYAYKVRCDTQLTFSALTNCTFIYNYRRKRHLWISSRSNPSLAPLCLYQNLSYLKMFFGVDIDIGVFKEIYSGINTLCVEQTMHQIRMLTNMEIDYAYF